MNDLGLLIMILVLLAFGIFGTFWSKKSAMWEAKFNLWPWYRFLPGVVEPMYGKEKDLENSFAIKLTTWWHRFIGIMCLIFATILILIFLGNALGSIAGGCGNDQLESKTSPDGRNKVIIFVRNCGATTDWAVNASILAPDKALDDNEVGNIFTSDGDHGAATQTNQIGGPLITAEWTDASTLQIKYAHGTRFFLQQPDWYGIKITYTEL